MLVQTLNEEYGVHPVRKNFAELVSHLDQTINHDLTDAEMETINKANKLADLSPELQERVAHDLYIKQDFKTIA